MAPAVLASRAKGGQVRTKVGNASGRHMPTYDSCLVTLTGLVLRVLPRLALRVRTRATYACLASTCWLSITLGALLSADTAGSHFYGGNTADGSQRVRTLLHRRVASAAAQGVCVSHSAGLAGTSAGSSVQQRTPGGMWPLLCCQICHVCCVPSRSRQVCAFVSAPARRPVWARLGLWLCPTSNVAQRYRGNRDDA